LLFVHLQVLLRGRVHTVRGKGKSAFLVLRQQSATVQCAMFVDDVTVSKGMVKYTSSISRESIVDIEGKVVVPEGAIQGCSQQVGGCYQLLLTICIFTIWV
jgi:aspartyl-tRNA synthetase